MKYQFIEEHKHEFAIVVMCGVLTVSESGFYTWRKRPTCRRKREDAHLIQEIQQVFETHHRRYGSPRIQRDLRDEGIRCSRATRGQADASRGAVSQKQTASCDNDEKRRDASGCFEPIKS